MRSCVICEIQAAMVRREHLQPARSLQDAYAAEPSPFGLSNGEAKLNSDSAPLQLTERQPLLLPANPSIVSF